MAQWPNLTINLQLSNDYIDIIENNIDIAIRAKNIDAKSFHAELLLSASLGVFAAPNYLAQASPIKRPDDLTQHRCLAHADFKPPQL